MTHLKRIDIHHLRNLTNINLNFSPQVNLFFGDNGSGKTSLLEAISILGTGRSFRSHKTRSLIQYEKNSTVLFAELLDLSGNSTSIGVEKDRSAQSTVRLDGETLNSAVPLAQKLPLQIINADSFRLVEGPSIERRHFLDWMVFHVKPDFSELWKRFRRVLKQRNRLLKNGSIGVSQLRSWDLEFVALSQQIHLFRQDVHRQFCEFLTASLVDLPESFLADIDLSYQPGWDLELGLHTVLKDSLDRDRRDGYTHYGPHRADVKILQSGKPASDALSRGQEKTLVVTMKWLQAQLYQHVHHKACVFLIDDLLAELDENNARQLMKRLLSLGGQLFITGLNPEPLKRLWADISTNFALFHVKQGRVSTLKNI